MVNARLLRVLPWLALVATLFAWECTHDGDVAKRALDQERIRVSDSALKALQADAAQQKRRIVQLQMDSARLTAVAVQLRADFSHELGRWQAMVAEWQRLAGRIDTVLVTPSDSLPTLGEVIAQANRTIESCRAGLSNCEERAANAEQRAAAEVSLRMNAEARASEFLKQSRIWEHRAKPSLFDQVKQIPRKAVVSSALYAAGYFTCKAGVVP